MNENRFMIIADDLASANDTAIQFVKHGMPALVVTGAVRCNTLEFSSYKILSFNSNTHALKPKDAYAKVRRLVRWLKAELNGFYFKKVDSVLYRNPGHEIDALMDELDIPLAIVCPSFPANMSVLEHGILKSGCSGVQTTIDAVKIFSDSMNKKVNFIPLEIIRQGFSKAVEFVISRYYNGIQVFIADAVSDNDLFLVYIFSKIIQRPHILAGSAALASKIAQSMEDKQTSANYSHSINCSAPTLVIAGTCQGETAAQVSALSNAFSASVVRFNVDIVKNVTSERAVALAFEEAARYMKNNPNLCIVAVDSLFESETQEAYFDRNQANNSALSAAISSGLGMLAGKLAKTFQFGVILTTGGDTALEICKSLNIAGIQPLVEIYPGIPIGRIIGGVYNDRYIITKSGESGNKDTLVEIIEYVNMTT